MTPPIQQPHGLNHSEALAGLLRRINQGVDPAILRQEAHRLIDQVTPRDITEAEQNLIREGYSAPLVGKLSVAFLLMGVMEPQGRNLRARLQGNHILLRVLAEHDIVRCWLADLEEIVEQLAARDELSDSAEPFHRLCHIVEHFNAWLEHFDREDDVLFPFLQHRGWSSLCRKVLAEHDTLRHGIGCLVRMIGEYRDSTFGEFRVNLRTLSEMMIPLMREHLQHEETILYPIAVAVIDDELAWKRLKQVCDQIGYCGVHT
ncbi:MAG: DUF438 domain-containing protein [Phycisphaerae bacterium]|nr:DUF438 domain-containing protein [Phycisphaerae bacterium]